ncbi:MAG: SsrA-binding protein SmpB [Prevotellaceae bacterium]|nr:SsrA-binding protein SmpB [Prevotellaceae bacterium]
MRKSSSNIEILNKKAGFEFILFEKFTAGIVLYGTEIKSIRAGKASIVESYCYFVANQLYIRGMHIAEYWWGNLNNHDPRRERKLLLNAREISKLLRRTKERGFTIVPTKLFISENGYAKLEIALARGKKTYDKRESIKEKDMRRAIDRQQ